MGLGVGGSSQKLKIIFFLRGVRGWGVISKTKKKILKGGLGVGRSSQKLNKKIFFKGGLGVGGVISKTQKNVLILFIYF